MTVAASRIYGVFAHGVSSAAITYMFMYSPVGSALPALLLWVLVGACSRVAYNLHNAGVAALTVASFLQGVFEIAGTASGFTLVIRVMGAGLVVVAVAAEANKR